MRNLKKILALVLALMMVLSVMVTASAAAFTDDADIDYKEAVEVMAAAGVLNGKPAADGTYYFDPTGTLDRASAAKIIAYILLGGDLESINAEDYEQPFTDAANSWAADCIAYIAYAGIVDGNGAGGYYPAKTLTGYEFAKMLLNAIGVDGTYTGDNWKVNVRSAAKTAGLLDNLEIVMSADITREQAAQMAFNAMNYSETETTVIGYSVTVGGQTQKFNSYLEAYVYANTFEENVPTIVPINSDSDSLMAINFPQIDSYPNTRDAFGRIYTSKWTHTDEDDNVTVIYSSTAGHTYKLPVVADMTTHGLKAYLVALEVVESADDITYAANCTYYVDGKPGTAGDVKASLKLGATVEIYTNKDGEFTNVVVVNDYTSSVKTVVEANEETETPAYITLADKTVKAVYTDAYAEGDVVLYNKAWNGTNYTVVGLSEADSVIGTLTAYTSKDVFTIGGETYSISALTGTTATVAGVQALYGIPMVYSLDASGNIVAVNVIPGTDVETPVSTDYAMLLAWDAAVTVKSGSTWLETTTGKYVSSITAQVKALLTDGSIVVYDLPIIEAGEDDKYEVTEGYYYTIINDKAVVLSGDLTTVENNAAAKKIAVDALNGALNKDRVYTYTAEDGVVDLDEMVIFTGTEAESVVANRKVGINLDATSTTLNTTGDAADATVIINDETVFIVWDKEEETYVALTGAKALQNTTILTTYGARVIVDVTVSEDEDVANLNVAKVVYAAKAPFTATGETPDEVEDLVYVNGEYTTTYDATYGYIYTYTTTNLEGETVVLTGAKDLAKGLYTYTTAGVLDKNQGATESKVGVIAGSTYQLGGAYVTVNGKTVVTDLTGEGLVAGATVLYLADSNTATYIFVIKAAE